MKAKLEKAYSLSGKVAWIIMYKRNWYTPWLNANQGVFLDSEKDQAETALELFIENTKYATDK